MSYWESQSFSKFWITQITQRVEVMNTERIYFYFLSIIPNWIQERWSVGCSWSLSECVCAAIRADGSHLRVSTGGPDWLIRFLPAAIKAASGASWKCSVVMASFWQGVLLLGLGLAASVRAGKWGRILSSFAGQSWKLGLFFCVCFRHESGLWAWCYIAGVDGDRSPGRHVALPSGFLSPQQLLRPGGRLQGGRQRLWLQ